MNIKNYFAGARAHGKSHCLTTSQATRPGPQPTGGKTNKVDRAIKLYAKEKLEAAFDIALAFVNCYLIGS